jgi:hypothetical protein
MQVVEDGEYSGKIIVVSELQNLPNFSVITSLNLSRCEIKDLDNFPHFPLLQKLILQHNKIEKGLIAFGKAHLDVLNTLDISNNPIWNFCEIVTLEKLPKLNHFSCLNCPVMETPFLRKMCFGYLYNLHSLNGTEPTNDAEGSDDEPMNNFKKSQYLFSNNNSKKKEFKLYNDFSHCPIISKATWYKKPDTPVVSADTLKRQIADVQDNGTVYGPVEKKRKENDDDANFNLNKEDGEETESMDTEQKNVASELLASGFFHNNQNYNHNPNLNYVQSNSSQNANGTHLIPNTNNNRGHMNSDTDDDDSYAADREDDDSSSSCITVEGNAGREYYGVNESSNEYYSDNGSNNQRHDEGEDAEESDSDTQPEDTQYRT